MVVDIISSALISSATEPKKQQKTVFLKEMKLHAIIQIIVKSLSVKICWLLFEAE